mgnify:FL=1
MTSKILSRVKLVDFHAAKKLLAGNSGTVPVDATWYMPNSPHNARDQFQNEDRIPGAVFFDLDKVCDPNSKYPHMLPLQEIFNSEVGELGISRESPVLVYDRSGIFSGPRAAWTFALFGHENVYLLDHYKAYKAIADCSLSESKSDLKPGPKSYKGIGESEFLQQYKSQVIEFEELEELVRSKQLAERYFALDARSTGRFTGADPEPRKGLSSGHVPGLLSLPFSKVLTSDGHYKSREELARLFKTDFGIDLTEPLQKEGIIVMCGTGVSAVILQVAIHKVAPELPVRVYDGSWTEWAQRAPGLIEKD